MFCDMDMQKKAKCYPGKNQCTAASRRQSLVKFSDTDSVMDDSPLPNLRLNLTAILPHDTSAGCIWQIDFENYAP